MVIEKCLKKVYTAIWYDLSRTKKIQEVEKFEKFEKLANNIYKFHKLEFIN